MANVVGSSPTYYGPSNTYMQAGTVANESVTILWKEGSFYFIEYNISGGLKKRAYVTTGSIPSPGTIPVQNWNTLTTRYVGIEGDVYSCPAATNSATNTAGEKICKIAKGTIVTYLSPEKPNGWTLIEFTYKALKKVRAYFWANNLGTSLPVLSLSDFKSFKAGDVIPAGYSMAGYTISQGFNDKTTSNKGHFAYDIAGATTDNVYPLFSGDVVGIRSTYSSGDGIGKAVVIKHSPINGETFYSAYLHLDSYSVSVGTPVNPTVSIGKIGNTGTTPVHLHLTVFTTGVAESDTSINGYATASPHAGTFEATSTVSAYKSSTTYPVHFYGATASDADTKYPRCGRRRFFDPLGTVSTNANNIKTYKSTLV